MAVETPETLARKALLFRSGNGKRLGKAGTGGQRDKKQCAHGADYNGRGRRGAGAVPGTVTRNTGLPFLSVKVFLMTVSPAWTVIS
ncbi:MAG: hypothetical protein KatS3mg004_3287 [Bryobacteraceae bacterium]|nr:MAG: hypothetical protein KatS3mg004_3287 [Bryobacteraceae bacterium]